MSKNQYEDLTEKQRKFAEFYLELNNGTKAAIAAGYEENSAHVAASRLLKNDKVVDYLESAREARKKAINDKLAKYAEDAVILLYDLARTSDSDSVRLQAVKDIMDRAGYKPTEKVENKNEHSGKIEFSFTDPNVEE